MTPPAAERIAAICRLAGTDGTDINAAMIRQGWAVADRRSPAPYLAEEKAARAAGAGIWAGQGIAQ
jgi:endonuclease YncB( thermonuclease family)